jgi:hypothetical protein
VTATAASRSRTPSRRQAALTAVAYVTYFVLAGIGQGTRSNATRSVSGGPCTGKGVASR